MYLRLEFSSFQVQTIEEQLEERIVSIKKTIDEWDKNPFIQKNI